MTSEIKNITTEELIKQILQNTCQHSFKRTCLSTFNPDISKEKVGLLVCEKCGKVDV